MLFVAYRENDLFRRYVPQLLEGLPIAGTFIVPEGTELKDRKDDFVAAVNAAVANGATAFLTDGTCNLYQYGEFTRRNTINGRDFWNVTVSLDGIFSREVGRWLNDNTAAENLGWFTDQLSAGRKVMKIVIVEDSINDHGLQGSGCPHSRADAWAKEVLETKFADAAVFIVEDIASAMQSADEENTLLVLDRHCGIKEVMLMADGGNGYTSLSNWHHKAMICVLPFETTAHQLLDRGTFPYEFDTVLMRADIQNQSAKIR